MEEEGIFYFFKHEDGQHTMVVADAAAAFPDLPGESEITFEELSGGARDDNRIWAWERAQEARSVKYLLWDHCFELPHKHLEAEVPLLDTVQAGKETHKLKVTGSGPWEVYDWPGEYAQRFDGINRSGGEQQDELQKIFKDNSRTVEIRMDEEATLAVVARGASNVKHLVAGHKLKLKRHFSSDGEYVLASVTHRASFGADYRAGKDALLTYQNVFTCFPSALPFRPKRTTPKPVVQGSQTAVVVGPKGEEIFTDKYGRVKVQFHWDRKGKNDEDSACWLRVGQLAAGRRWGTSFWPRIGQEVIVDFLEGDPDQPIIVGTVYNADQMPPYLGQGPDAKHKNDNKVSGFKSNTTKGGQGYNEWRFDDTKDKQQVFLHAEKNMDVRVKNDSMENVGHDKHLTVGGTKDGQNVGDYRELVFRDVHLHNKRNLTQHVGGDIQRLVGGEDGPGNVDEIIKGNRTVLVEGNVGEHVKGNDLRKVDGSVGLQVSGDRQAMVGGNDELKLSGALKEDVQGSLSLTVGQDRQVKVSQKDALEAGQEIHLKSGMKVVIEAGMELTLKSAGGFVKIDSTGVTIVGTVVRINSGGAAGSGSGASPESPKDPQKPQDAKEAKPEDPTAADDAKTGQKSN
jgi:type VI secretion system secreted protein VgrG